MGSDGQGDHRHHRQHNHERDRPHEPGSRGSSRGWRRLGALLVEAGLVSEHDLVEALAEQERSGQRLGEVLVARGLVSAAAVANALAEQRGSFLTTEYGFGTGLRALMGRSNVPDSEATSVPQ